MFISSKLNRTIKSSRLQIRIKEVRDDILILPDRSCRTVLEVSPVNFELKSEEEQDALIDAYEMFLNSLPCAIQILVQNREIDIDKYLSRLHKRLEKEKDKTYITQLTKYDSFLRSLVKNRVLTKRFYLVINYSSTVRDIEAAKTQIYILRNIICRNLMRMNIATRALDGLEILELFRSVYNPEQSKLYPLREILSETLNNLYVIKEK